MPKPVKSKKTYRQMSEELQKLLDWFENEELDLDEALDKYEQANALIVEMEEYLKTAENKVKKITASLK